MCGMPGVSYIACGVGPNATLSGSINPQMRATTATMAHHMEYLSWQGGEAISGGGGARGIWSTSHGRGGGLPGGEGSKEYLSSG